MKWDLEENFKIRVPKILLSPAFEDLGGSVNYRPCNLLAPTFTTSNLSFTFEVLRENIS